ncbi:MAG: TonB-dependent receptor [Spirochaetales bacterium]|jgi:iron complex outermembrane receptor protein|nr:TonB-dependent receptor [Spirochaetales bacterium]
MKKLFLILLTGAVLQTAFAQNSDVPAPDREADGSLDFVITAGRTLEATNKVTGQVTVITADDIAKSGASTITDVLETVPGIRLARERSGGSVDLSMRGISSESGREKVLVIVDGMRLNPIQNTGHLNWETINLSEVERIEVLDGGASVQYGDNAQAGVINIITKKSGEAKTDIALSAGSFFQNEQRFSRHQPTDWGSFTLSGGHQGTQGYQKHSAGDTGNGELRGTFDINDVMSLQANAGFYAKNGLLPSLLTKAQFEADPTQNAGPSADTFSTFGIIAGAGFAWAINDTLSLDVPVSYNFTRLKYYYASRTEAYDIMPQMLGLRPKITAEMKPGGMGLRFTGGVDALVAFSEVENSSDLVQESNPTTQTMSEITLGPWALVNFEPLPLLALNAGLRYDTAFIKAHMDSWSGSVTEYDENYVPISVPRSYAAGDESTNFDALVYEAGVAVNPFDFLKIYAKYGTQFRYPYLDCFVEVPYTQGGTVSLNTGIKAEKGWTVEGGIGLNIKGIVRLDANCYYLWIDNEIAYVFDGMSYGYINQDPIDRLGSNIGLKLTPVKYVELDLDYGFVKAEFSEGANEGKFVPLVAEHNLSGSIMLNLPFGLSLGPNVLYKSEMYQQLDTANAQSVIDPSLIWGLQARYVINKFKGELAAQLSIHNLLDATYASLVYYMGPMMGTGYYVDSNMGRSVNLSLQYRF